MSEPNADFRPGWMTTSVRMDACQRWGRRTTPWLTALAPLSLINFVLAPALDRRQGVSYAIDYGVQLGPVAGRGPGAGGAVVVMLRRRRLV
jgi:integral membrane sensor domain MASE1